MEATFLNFLALYASFYFFLPLAIYMFASRSSRKISADVRELTFQEIYS